MADRPLPLVTGYSVHSAKHTGFSAGSALGFQTTSTPSFSTGFQGGAGGNMPASTLTHSHPHSHGATASSAISAAHPSHLHAKPIPMKLFAIGDQDRTPPFCTSRICSVRLTHLAIEKCLERGLSAVTIAVKMERSKRTLRSTEIELPEKNNGLLDTELDLSLSLQYPHYLKQRGNLLLVMLQRRKRYKNRRILGYKTLAVGTVDMNEVLQRAVDQELHLYASPKDKNTVMARISMISLSTQPVSAVGKEPFPLEDENTSEEEEFFSDLSDSEGDAAAEDAVGSTSRGNKVHRKLVVSGRQANLKQKFISLLRRFRASESGFDGDADVDHPEEAHEKAVLEDELLDELDFDSDSGPEFFDNISVQSTPRPHLSPYFKPGRSVSALLVPNTSEHSAIPKSMEKSDEGSKNNSDSHPDNLTDEDGGGMGITSEKKGDDVPNDDGKRKSRATVLREKSWSLRDKEKRNDKETVVNVARDMHKMEGRKLSHCLPIEATPRTALLEQLHAAFQCSDDELPLQHVWVNGNHSCGKMLADRLQAVMPPVMTICTTGDLKVCFSQLTSRFHRSFGRGTNAVRIVLCGGDAFVNATLRAYVELLSDRPSDWQTGIRFVLVPVGGGGLNQHLGQIDTLAAQLFDEQTWSDVLEAADVDWEDVISVISSYVQSVDTMHNLPVAQAMINLKTHSVGEVESPQMFIPFLSDVRVNGASGSTTGTDPAVPGVISDAEEREKDMGAALGQHLTLSGGTIAASATGTSALTPSTHHPALSLSTSHSAVGGGGASSGDFSPPHSPNVAQSHNSPLAASASLGHASTGSNDLMELQVDFWVNDTTRPERPEVAASLSQPRTLTKDIPTTKTSLKTAFKYLCVARPVGQNSFTLVYATKERKIPLMRALGKKGKEGEKRSVMVDGVSRLICRISKPQSMAMKVVIDGCDWQNINFFQLSPQWHSTVKQFPLLIYQDT